MHDETRGPQARTAEEPSHAPQDARVLVVEDNALVASMYEAALRRVSEGDRLPLAVEIARDGGEALARLLRPPTVDVVVTDVFMPDISGVELVEQIRAAPLLSSLPVVVATSGGAREEDRLAALGITRFLRKPVSFEGLADAVRDALRGRGSPAGATAAAGLTSADPVGIDRLHAIPVSRR
ncbi:response regulator [Anaeromyxobacter sp. Fw109-5]|uniref:response regulator n=1 Tax=Anaeromyxobacter sp. (strain Fw109-5) TaxID=404589 RepID=UPI0000ED6E6B|nr:response regulator [Anaeromyxobacter sp. Fw109-5]ABS28041.1 response regulator receiver protein [Anaeromyxobacter sp. Fw109-5]